MYKFYLYLLKVVIVTNFAILSMIKDTQRNKFPKLNENIGDNNWSGNIIPKLRNYNLFVK